MMLESATHNISDALTLAAVEGEQVELECSGEPGAVPRPGYRWSVASGGEELSILNRPGQPGLNFTAETEANGTRITCTSEQRNTYNQVQISAFLGMFIILHLLIMIAIYRS